MTINCHFYADILCASSKFFFNFFLVDLFTALEERTFVSRMLWSRFRFRTDWNPQHFVRVKFILSCPRQLEPGQAFFKTFRFRDVFLWLIFCLFLNTFPWHFAHDVPWKSLFSVSVCSRFFKILQISPDDLFTATSKTKFCPRHVLRTFLFWSRFQTATVCTGAFQISHPQHLELPVGAPKFAVPWHLVHGQKNARRPPPTKPRPPPQNLAPPLETVTPFKTVTLKK